MNHATQKSPMSVRTPMATLDSSLLCLLNRLKDELSVIRTREFVKVLLGKQGNRADSSHDDEENQKDAVHDQPD